MDRCMVDATSGGALVDKTPTATKDLLAKMARNNAQQFSNRMSGQIQGVNEVRTSPMDQQRIEKFEELASMVRQLALGQR